MVWRNLSSEFVQMNFHDDLAGLLFAAHCPLPTADFFKPAAGFFQEA